MRTCMIAVGVAAALLCSQGRAANRRAVLIGINNYNSAEIEQTQKVPGSSFPRKALAQGDVRYWEYPDLRGPIADVALVEGLLKSPDFGFGDNDIVKLLNGAATAQAILTTLQSELVDHANSGDVRFVYYSGHGNYIKNLGSKERDQLDQTIVPADNRLGVVDVRDKEISRILWAAAKKGVVITFIADSCHSGSLARGPANGRVVRSNNGVRSGSPENFTEPIVDDPATIDPQTKRLIDPEDLGVLTLAAAQRNQESIEQIFTDDTTHQVHGALTFALVRALQTEGPHASMNIILDRVQDFLSAENLFQTPILGGKARAEKDILGQPVSPASFSVSVKEVRGRDIILRGGQAIGIYSGCELRKIRATQDEPVVTIRVTESPNLAESIAQSASGTDRVSVGDRFEVTRWVVPPESLLKVYIPPPADISTIQSMIANLKDLRQDPSIEWIFDPTQENPSAVIRWNGSSWILDRIGSTVTSTDVGRPPSASDIRSRLTGPTKLFFMVPPATGLVSKIDLGSGAHSAIEKLTTGNFSDAQYGLFGREQDGRIEYAWVATDGELDKAVLGTAPGSKGNGETLSPLPIRTDWYAMLDKNGDDVGFSITDSASRLGTIRAWLKLQGRPGQTIFPYDLTLRKVGSQNNVRGGQLSEGERYKVYLTLRPELKARQVRRRWIYVFDINGDGKGTLIFPELGKGNEGNHLPLSQKEEDVSAPSQRSIPLFTDRQYDFEVSAPFGADTFVLLTSDRQISHPEIFQINGVKRKGASYQDDLENLLANVGSTERGVDPYKSPGEWSVQRLLFTTVQK